MPLILAVEPDRKQAEAVAALARGVLRSEVIVTDSADAALAVLARRVPDLLLTSLLLPPKDEAKIADRLRALDANGTSVQTLVIPMLASSGKRSQESKKNVNRLWKSKAKASAPDGCAPEVFASQISEYLRRAATEEPQRGRQLPNLEIEQTPVLGAAPAHVPEEPSRTNDVGRESQFRDPPQTDPPRTEPIGAELHHTPPPGAKPLIQNEVRSNTPPNAESLILQPLPQAPPIPLSPIQSSLIQPPPLQAPLHPPLVQPPLAQVPPAQSAPRPEGPEAQAQKRRTAPRPAHHPEQKTAAGGPPPYGARPADALRAEPPPQVATPRAAPPFVAAGKPAQGAPVRPVPGSAFRASANPTGPAQGPVGAKPSPNPAPPRSPAQPAPNAAPVVTQPPARTASTVSERLRRLTTEQPPAPQVAPRALTQPAAASVERTPSGDAGQSRETAVRPMLVLGALDLGAFVEELTAAKEQPDQPAAIQTNPVQPLAVQPAAVQVGAGQAGAVQTGTAQPAAAQAATDPSRRDRGQKPRRAVQDEWGIFDPQQAGFAALFAKLEEITEQDDVPVEPPA